MKRRKINIPTFIRKKYFWQAALAFLSILFLIFFIRNERFELAQIKETISGTRWSYLILGIIVAFIYMLLQGWLYVSSFRTVHQKIPLSVGVLLFLKRNLIGIFVPGGTISSLAFFNKDLEKHKLNKTQQYLGSYIFVFASTVSILVVAIPAFVMLFLKKELNFIEVSGFVFIALFIALLGYALITLISNRKGFGYRMISKYKPEWLVILDEITHKSINKTKLIQTFLISVAIELTGVIHLYIAIIALNANPSLEVAFTGYVVMIILLSVSPFLKGLGAIELSLTYLLVQYGYTETMAASVTLLFRFFEFWLPLFTGLLIFIFKRDGLLTRILPSLIILILGITNIFSALTPAIPARIAFIHEWFPAGFTELSNFTVLVFGLMLIILSIYLFVGTKNAWKAALALTFFSIVGHLVKAIDYEEALFALVAFLSLIVTRKSYTRKSQIALRSKAIRSIAFPIIVFLIYAVAGFYFLDQIHFKKEFNFSESLLFFIKTLFYYDNQSFLPKTIFARDFLFSVRFFGASTLIFIIWSLFRPGKISKSQLHEEKEIASLIVSKHGHSSLDYFKTYSDKIYFFNSDKTGFLSYRIAENYAVVLEDPVAPSKEIELEIILRFKKFCTEQGLITIYYRIPDESLSKYQRLGFKAILIGQEAIVNLEDFSLAGGVKRPLRNALNKVKNAGFEHKIYLPTQKEGLLQKLKQVSDEWLKEHHSKEIVFTQGIFDEQELKKSTIITLENQDEKVIAFVNLIDDYSKQEGTFDLMRKSKDAPNGTMDFIFIKMFEYFKEKNYKTINLGLVPLAGFQKGTSLKQRATFFLVEYLKQNSRFGGLYEFKEKYEPQWSARYLVYQNTSDLLKLPLVLSKISKVEKASK